MRLTSETIESGTPAAVIFQDDVCQPECQAGGKPGRHDPLVSGYLSQWI